MISLTRKIMPQGCLHLVGSFVSSSGLFKAKQNNNLTSHIPFELMWVGYYLGFILKKFYTLTLSYRIFTHWRVYSGLEV